MCSIGRASAALLEAFVPSRCGGCGEAARGACAACVRATELLPRPEVVRVGEVELHAAFLYSSPLREILHHGKYRDGRSALRVAALLAAERFVSLPPPAILVPVPLGRARQRVRGYNQAETAAAMAAPLVGAELRRWLVRVRETDPQVGRSPAARARNLRGAFSWVGPRAVAIPVWIVDDVVTTGATLLAAIAAVPCAGAGLICGVAIARAGAHLRPLPAHRPRGIDEIMTT